MPVTPISFSEYQQLCANYDKVPLSVEVLADTETPLSAYYKLSNDSFSFLFESIEGGERWGRYSIIGLQCREIIKVHQFHIEHTAGSNTICNGDISDPLDYIDNVIKQIKVPQQNNLPRFYGGFVGYFGYDTVRYVEPRLLKTQTTDNLHIPDILLMRADELVIFDTVSGTLLLITHIDADAREASYNAGVTRLQSLQQQLKTSICQLNDLHLNTEYQTTQSINQDFTSNTGREAYMRMVETIKDYIHAGDVMQVVPSQRLSIEYKESALDLYRALRFLNPSPYMYLLNCGEFNIIGSSPEILARIKDSTVTVRPLAGTRKRGCDAEQDKLLEQELLADAKEIAEHLMLIDLGRNDIGKISQTGSVVVTDQMNVEYYSHVMHIASNVEGQLLPQISAIDVIRATHPAGTLSGAPKVRAMEIIDEFEQEKRAFYAGTVGYIGWSQNGTNEMDMAIAIRTALLKDKRLFVQAGGGVVADSDPASEWQETINKASAMFRAVAMVKSNS